MSKPGENAPGPPGSLARWLNDLEDLKSKGDKKFRSGDYLEAVKWYDKVQEAWTEGGGAGGGSRAREEGIQVEKLGGGTVAINSVLNRSLCHLRMGRLEDCVRDCDWVLDSRGGELKAMFRRGKARVGLAEHRSGLAEEGGKQRQRLELLKMSEQDFNMVLRLQPENAEASKELEKVLIMVRDSELKLQESKKREERRRRTDGSSTRSPDGKAVRPEQDWREDQLSLPWRSNVEEESNSGMEPKIESRTASLGERKKSSVEAAREFLEKVGIRDPNQHSRGLEGREHQGGSSPGWLGDGSNKAAGGKEDAAEHDDSWRGRARISGGLEGSTTNPNPPPARYPGETGGFLREVSTRKTTTTKSSLQDPDPAASLTSDRVLVEVPTRRDPPPATRPGDNVIQTLPSSSSTLPRVEEAAVSSRSVQRTASALSFGSPPCLQPQKTSRDARQTGSPLAADAGRTFKRPRNSLEFERIWKELYKDLEQGDRIRTDVPPSPSQEGMVRSCRKRMEFLTEILQPPPPDEEKQEGGESKPTIASVIPELFKDSLQPELLHQICHSFLLHIRISKPKPSPSEIRTMIRWIESLTLCRRFSTISSLLDVEERKVVEGLFQHLLTEIRDGDESRIDELKTISKAWLG